jgi:hypothetical protein
MLITIHVIWSQQSGSGPDNETPLSDSLSDRTFFHYKGEKRPGVRKVLPDNG